ncbi:DUF3344 domain-containing protein [Streptomyces sp. NPDC004647]|uniref:DUF3344 domain-containing protein n=1 Tax=Streptomyces sp. NPDC004647 TaxID=3154671 RepID=UPI0033AA7C98
MRVSLGRTGRAVLCVVSSVTAAMVLPQSVAAPAEKEEPRIPFAERYRAVQHGGIARAANSSATCQSPATREAVSCAKAQQGNGGVNGDYRMTYIDVDRDRNTYNSSRAELRLPKGATVSYARLYWGGNLRVGEQKPPEDNGRVLFAEPGGQYKEILADSTIGHRTQDGVDDAFSASADVTRIVKNATPGAYTVAQVNVAMGHSAAGAWGGWTLVVAYADKSAPLRDLAIWDGFESLSPDRSEYAVDLDGLRIPEQGRGSLGVVAYDGDRGADGNSLGVQADDGEPVMLRDAANPVDDAFNSTIADRGRLTRGRQPSYANTLGYDSDIHDLGPALSEGADHLTVGFGTEAENFHLGALFLQADTRR